MIDLNTLTDQDDSFLKTLKSQGVSSAEAFSRLEKVKATMHKQEASGIVKAGVDAISKGLRMPVIGTAIEGGLGAIDKVIGDENKEFSVADVVTGTIQNVPQIPKAIGEGFQQARESTARRSEVMNPIAEQKGALGEKAMKAGIGVLNTLDYASKIIGGGLSPLVEPTIKETIENLSPEAQDSLNNTIQSITAKFESLSPETQEALRGTGVLAEALTSIVGSPVLARSGRQFIKAGTQAGRQISGIVTDGAKELAQSLKTLPNMADETIEKIAFKMDDLINRRKQITDKKGNIIDFATEEGLATQRSQIANELSTAYFDTVDPAIQRKLLGQDDLKRQYMEQFVEGWVDLDKPSILEVGVNRLDRAIKQIEKSIKQTGNEIGDFRQKISTVKVSPDDLNPVLTNFDKELAKFGLQQKNGKIVGLPRRKTKLNQNEISQLQQMRNDLVDIKADPTAQLIIDVRSKIDSDINFGKDRRDISSNLDGIAKSTRSDLAEVNRQIIGHEQADILERYSDLNDLITAYRNSSSKGKNPEFFLKRIMTERGRVPRGVADRIFQETGIDLSADAAIINSVTRDLAPARMKSALAQEVKDSGIDAGLALTALISPQAAASKFAADQALNVATKFLRTRFGKNSKLLKALDELQKNDEALLELRKMMQSSDVDVKGYSNADEAVQKATDFKKAGSAESALIEEAKKYKTADEFMKSQGETVYHGTNADFDKFDIKKIGTQTDDGLFGKGFYFTPNKAMAKTAPRGGKAKFVKEVKLDIKNPLEINKFNTIEDLANHLDMSESAFTKGSDGIIRPVNSQINQFTSHLQDLGYDGVYVRRKGLGDEVVVFNPSQIKTKSQLKQIWEEANAKAMSNDDELLKTLTPKQLERFKKGTPEEQQEALKFLKQKQEIESSLTPIDSSEIPF